MNGHHCCSPETQRREPERTSEDTTDFGRSPDCGSPKGTVLVPAGTFLMGGEGPECWADDGESPIREVRLDAFRIARCAVANREFRAFVEATDYRTEAEQFGWSFVFHNQVPKKQRIKHRFDLVPELEWWAKVEGACWRRPGGPGTHLKGLGDHPVVHISAGDAKAFCNWRGVRLPTEAEWECAARGGLAQTLYPWGDDLVPGGKHHCNIWQGNFPHDDRGEDGHVGTAPVRSFPANGYGLRNVAGNVWEWCADRFSPDHHLNASLDNPTGPEDGDRQVIRGGSFLCHHSYCTRYRLSARSAVTPDSGTCHLGFRYALDATG